MSNQAAAGEDSDPPPATATQASQATERRDASAVSAVLDGLSVCAVCDYLNEAGETVCAVCQHGVREGDGRLAKNGVSFGHRDGAARRRSGLGGPAAHGGDKCEYALAWGGEPVWKECSERAPFGVGIGRRARNIPNAEGTMVGDVVCVCVCGWEGGRGSSA